jgi:hypothetical protein
MECLWCDIWINFGLESLKGFILLGLEIQTVDRAACCVQTVFVLQTVRYVICLRHKLNLYGFGRYTE